MVTSLGEAVIEVGADTKGFKNDVDSGVQKGLGGVVPVADKTGKTGGKALGAGLIATLGRAAGPIGAIFAGFEVVGFFKDSITAASDFGESLNALNVVYGKNADQIIDLGDTAASAFGLSRTELNGFAVQFSSFAKQLAGGGKSSADVFEEIAGRATDFASVMNLEVADAAAAFQSGLAGETEPLKAFGIDLSDVTVSAFAYANGIAEAGTQLTEAQKVQARYGALMEATNQVQGDFANTSDGLANQQRILKGNWADLQIAVGNFFLPTMEKLVAFVNGAVTGAIALFSGGLGEASGATTGLGQTLSSLAEFFGPIIEQVKTTASAIASDMAPVFREIARFVKSEFMPAFRALLPAIQPFVEFMVEAFGSTLRGVIQFLGGVIKGLVKIITGVVNVIAGILTGDWARAWKGARQIVGGVVDILKGLVTGLWTIIKGRFDAINRIIPGIGRWFRDAYLSVNMWIVNMINKVIEFPRRASIGLRLISGILRERIGNAFRNIVKAVAGHIGSLIDRVRAIPGSILSAVGNLGSLLYRAGQNVIQGLINGILSMIGRVGSSMSNIAGTIRAYLPFSPAKEGPLSGPGNPENSGMKIIQMLGDGMDKGQALPVAALSRALQPLSAQRAAPGAASPARAVMAAPAAPVNIVQNFLGPTTSGGRLQEMNWNIRYATQARSETIGGVAR
jgi:hypothetical protein